MTASLLILALLMTATTALWLVSLGIKDCSIADIAWAPAFALVAWATVAIAGHTGLRGWLVLALVSLWGLRLGLHILARHHGEDYRYAAMRRKFGPIWWWRSLLQVFVLQALLVWIISWPLQAAVGSATPLGVLDYAGAAIAVTGLLTEAIADWQLTQFRADPANKGMVMDRGIWSWSRHPNYFGDALMWWGYFLIGFAALPAWWLLLSPVAMTVLLLRVSGVTMLEETIVKRRPGYAEYIARTSVFVPWPPKAK